MAAPLVASLSNQPATFVGQDVVFLNRRLDRSITVGLIVNDADQLCWRTFEMVDRPGVQVGGLVGCFAMPQ